MSCKVIYQNKETGSSMKLIPIQKIFFTLGITAFIFLTSACSRDEKREERFIENGNRLLEERELEAAKLEFNNAYRENQHSTEALMGLAKVLELERNWGRLEVYLQRVLEMSPQHIEARLKLANLYMASGRIDSALDQSTLLQDIAPDDSRVRVLRAAVLTKIGDKDQAKSILDDEYKKNPANVDVVVLMVTQALANKNNDQALSILDRALEQKPDNSILNILKLDVLNRNGDFKAALSIYNHLMQLHPANEQIPTMLAKQYFARGETDKALRVLDRFARESGSESAYYRAVELLMSSKGIDAGEERLKQYITDHPELYRLRALLVDIYLKTQRQEKATAELDELIEDTEDNKALNARMRNKKVRLLLSKGEIEAAQQLLQSVLALDSDNGEALATQAEIMLQNHNVEGAVKTLRLALRSNPESSALLLMLARAHEMEGERELAGEYYARARKADGSGIKESLAYARFLLQSKDFEQVKTVLAPFVERGGATPEVLKLYAQVCLNTGDWEEAEKVADKLAQAGGDAEIIAHIRGLASMGKDDLDAAVESLEAFRAAAPDSFKPVVLLVNAYLRAGETQRAVQFIDSILEASPNNHSALYLKASIADKEGQLDAAQRGFEQVLKLSPEHIGASEGLIKVLLKQKDYAAAEKVYLEAQKHNPDRVALGIMGAAVYEQQGDIDQALAIYRKLYEKKPDLDIVANNYAVLLQQQGGEKSTREAIQVAERLRQSPLPAFADTLGWLYHLAGRYSEADPLLRRALAGLPDNAEIQYHMAANLAAQNQPGEAKALLERVVSDRRFEGVGWYERAVALHDQL